VEHPATDPDALGALERVVHEPVRVVAVVTRPEVVRAVVGDRIDLLGANELLELDQARARAGGRVDLLLAEDHVLAAPQLVPLGDLLVGNLLAVLGADPLLLDPGSVGCVDLVKVDGLVLGRRVHLDRQHRQAERDRAVPDRAWHRFRVASPRR
jgi:hypothetical protein